MIRFALLLLLLASIAHAAPPTERACDAAAAQAEQDWNLPAGILAAVGTIESGRASVEGTAPWPWTINAAGRGSYHETKDGAVAAVLAIMAGGFPYIDVGCFQVDLAYHAGVFRSLDDAFDPHRNAQAAARILMTERLRAPDWATAVARYHSATPELGTPYLRRVLAALPNARRRALSAQAEALAPPPNLPTVIYGRPMPARPPQPQIIHIANRENDSHSPVQGEPVLHPQHTASRNSAQLYLK